MTVTLEQPERPDAPALLFFVAFVAGLLVTTVLLARSCERPPAEPGPVSLNSAERTAQVVS